MTTDNQLQAAEERLHDNTLLLIQQINESGLPYSQAYAEYVELETLFFDNYNLKGYTEFVEDLVVLSPLSSTHPLIF